MKKLIAIGLGGLVGCASSGIRGPVVTDAPNMAGSQRNLPSWVEVPAWMEQESQREHSEVGGYQPSVSVVTRLCMWSAQEPGMPAFPEEGYAILGEAEADRIMAKLSGNPSASMLTSPRVVVGLGQKSSVAILAPGEPRGGVVFFTSPTTIDEKGVDLRFSFQCARLPLPAQGKSSHPKLGTTTLDGHTSFGVGQWYVRAVEGDYPMPAGTEMALFIQIARVDYPKEPVGKQVATLSTAIPFTE